MITLRPPLQFSEIGSKPNQEDYIYPETPDADSRVFILCDGMGGHERGEVASSTVARTLGRNLSDIARTGQEIDRKTFDDSLSQAYDALDRMPGSDSPRKPGTTLAALCFNSSSYLAAHIGDSRIYHLRPSLFDSEAGSNGIIYRSPDHSLVNDLVRAGQITEEEARTHPRRNVITRAMQPGLEHRFEPTVRESADILPGDYFFLCSDGVLERMSDSTLCEIIATPDLTDAEKMGRILALCNLGTRDNYSAILIPVADITAPRKRNPYRLPLIILSLIILIACGGIAAYYAGWLTPKDAAAPPSADSTAVTPPEAVGSAPVIDTIILSKPLVNDTL